MVFTFPSQSTKFRSGPDKTDGKGKIRTKIRKERKIRQKSSSFFASAGSVWFDPRYVKLLGKASKKKSIFLGKSPKLWVGGGQES